MCVCVGACVYVYVCVCLFVCESLFMYKYIIYVQGTSNVSVEFLKPQLIFYYFSVCLWVLVYVV